MSGQTGYWSGTTVRMLAPSMEGRTIVRPDTAVLSGRSPGQRSFNGGPDNCPARLPSPTSALATAMNLQWRAGQLSGQTPKAGFGGGTIVALQWRAGQLSGQTRRGKNPRDAASDSFNGGPDNCPARPANSEQPNGLLHPFNGGPDNCPARREFLIPPYAAWVHLQWRAGQLSGQTARLIWGCLPACSRVVASGVGSRSF